MRTRSRPRLNAKAQTTERGTALAFLAIVIIFLPLSWTDGFLWGWPLLVVDSLLMALLLMLEVVPDFVELEVAVPA